MPCVRPAERCSQHSVTSECRPSSEVVTAQRKRAGARPRVVVVGQGPPTAGGIPTFVTQLVSDARLQERVDVDYFNTTPSVTKKPGKFALSNVLLLLTHAREIFRRARRADVVHLNLAPAPLLPLIRALVLAVAARLGRARVILHAHTGRLHIAAQSFVYRLVLRIVLRAVDVFVVVSVLAEDAAQPLGGRVVRLPNGIDPEGVDTGPKSDPPELVFVGTICERKGLIDLRDALVRLKEDGGGRLELHAVLIGDAKQEGPGVFERIRGSYADAGLEEIEFTGALAPDDVKRRLARADIFCLPSHWEGFPLSLLEGMAAGAAIVASDVGDIPEMLDHGNAGVVVPAKQTGALHDALARLIKDPVERERLGSAARARVESTYGQDVLIDAVADLYEETAPSYST